MVLQAGGRRGSRAMISEHRDPRTFRWGLKPIVSKPLHMSCCNKSIPCQSKYNASISLLFGPGKVVVLHLQILSRIAVEFISGDSCEDSYRRLYRYHLCIIETYREKTRLGRSRAVHAR